MQTQYIKKTENSTFYYRDKEMVVRHREDGPAIERVNGDRFWYLNGDRHREDGPAVEYADGDRWWYLNGELHREDGPAIELADGDRWWYLNGIELSEKEFNTRVNLTPIEMTIEEIAEKLGLDANKLKVIA